MTTRGEWDIERESGLYQGVEQKEMLDQSPEALDARVHLDVLQNRSINTLTHNKSCG
jgi:hypothetical protein